MRIVALSIAPRSLTLLDAVLLRRLPPTVRSRVPALFASGVLLIVAADGDLPSGLCDGAPALAVADDCSLHVGEPAWVTTLALTVGSGTAEAATTDEIEMALP
jgi:hypothetical protein